MLCCLTSTAPKEKDLLRADSSAQEADVWPGEGIGPGRRAGGGVPPRGTAVAFLTMALLSELMLRALSVA